MSRPIVVDVDGTMSRPDRSIEGRVFDALRAWEAPVVVATGKALPYPVALCDFAGIDVLVVAENGGVVATDEFVEVTGDPAALHRFDEAFRAAGHDYGWGDADLVNRWRETELAASHDVSKELLDRIAAECGLEVLDSGFAYHVKSPDVSKGHGLRVVAEGLGIDPTEFAAIGDSENDVSTFAVVGVSYAVANAAEPARVAADRVTRGSYADGLLEALDSIQSRGPA